MRGLPRRVVLLRAAVLSFSRKHRRESRLLTRRVDCPFGRFPFGCFHSATRLGKPTPSGPWKATFWTQKWKLRKGASHRRRGASDATLLLAVSCLPFIHPISTSHSAVLKSCPPWRRTGTDRVSASGATSLLSLRPAVMPQLPADETSPKPPRRRHPSHLTYPTAPTWTATNLYGA